MFILKLFFFNFIIADEGHTWCGHCGYMAKVADKHFHDFFMSRIPLTKCMRNPVYIKLHAGLYGQVQDYIKLLFQEGGTRLILIISEFHASINDLSNNFIECQHFGQWSQWSVILFLFPFSVYANPILQFFICLTDYLCFLPLCLFVFCVYINSEFPLWSGPLCCPVVYGGHWQPQKQIYNLRSN